MDLEHIMDRVIRVLTPIGLGALLIMMAAVVINVFGRAFFRAPLYGAVELVQIAGVFLVSFIGAYTQFKKSNISVGILVDSLSPRAQGIFDIFTMLVSLGMVAVLVWAASVIGLEMVRANEITGVYEIIKYPFRFVWVFGLIVLFAVCLAQFIETLGKAVKR